MNKLKTVFIGLILLTILFSCNKNDAGSGHNTCGEKFTASIKSADLQNCKYKTGSYWVFIDSLDNAFDSISITKFNQSFINDACGNSYETHAFQTSSSNSFELTDYVVVAGGLFKDFNGAPNSGTQIYDDYNSTTSMANYHVEKFDSVFIF